MAAKLTKGAKIGIMVIAAGAIIGGKVLWYDNLPREAKESVTLGQVELPKAPNTEGASLTNVAMLPLPSKEVSGNGTVDTRHLVMGWNAQVALAYATGGVKTTVGSLFDKAGLNVTLELQNNCDLSIAEIVKFCHEYKKDPSIPAVFASYMGDGMPNFFSILKRANADLPQEYQAVAFYAMGRSAGEDKLMGPAEWKTNPQAALGKVVACYLRDGDMNILLKWAGDNGLRVNPDETTYDSTAINLMAATDYLEAANKYINNVSEDRFLIQGGKKTSQTISVVADGVATWTPGDVNIARLRGGLVSIASTKEYSSQMPNITITCKKWLIDHRDAAEKWVIAMAQAGDQVRSYKEALAFACEVQADVYGEREQGHDGKYWLKYYNGVTEVDAQGNRVELGGSMAFNLVDAANIFGIATGDGKPIDRYRKVYTTFGDILSKMYPEFMADYPDYNTVVDKSIMISVISNHPELLEGKAIKVEYAPQMTEAISKKSYSIEFETSSSTIKPQSYEVLDQIFSSAVVAENLKVGVYGHTDDVGDPTKNMELSKRRAASVVAYLEDKGLAPERMESEGYGEDRPIESNQTPAGRAKNRRVEIVLGR